MIQIRRALLLFFLLTMSFCLNSTRVSAQDVPETEALELDDSIVVEEVFVTGSLIPRGDFVSKAPIATITSSQFEMSNAVNVENLINSMPQVVGGADRSSSFGQGIATANLRGLGENRTLVLINSRRFVPTFPDGGTVDLNFIPVGLIDRVEILTGGASTAYGSDALAGVINFILKEETDGWEFNGGGEMTERGDSEIYNFNITNGGTFANGRGKYLVHGDFLERKPLYYTDRAVTDSPLIDAADGSGLINAPNRFPITPNASMFIPNFTVPGGPQGFFGLFDNDGNLNLSSGDEGGFLGNGAFGIPQGTDLDSINGFSYLQLPQERKSFKGKISYDFGKVEAYADVYYSKSEVPFQWGGPFLGFPTTTGYTATIENNPFINQEAKQFISANFFFYGLFLPQRVQYRDDNINGIADTVRLPFFYRMFTRDIGITENPRTFESQQFEFGLKGSLGSNWGYEIFAQLGEVETILDPGPLLNPERIQQGLLLTEDGTQCQDQSNGCVPLNLWSDDIGAEAAAFITYPDGAGRSVTNNEQNVIMGTVSGNTGDWFSLPGDPGPIGLVFGFEYLEIKSEIDTPAFIEQQLFEGFSTNPFSLNADVDTVSLFGEAVVPLVAGKPGIDFLELELGWRVAEHSITGNASSFKAALSYYPTTDVQLRASFNKAIRSPAINELYRDQQNEFNAIEDPCTNVNPFKAVGYPGNTTEVERSPSLDAACISTGIPEANLYDPLLKEVSGVEDLGGNPNLVNEDAQTLSLGIVWSPYSIDALSLSLDYFQVEIDEYISTTPITAAETMRNCFDTARGVGGPGSPACTSIGRDADGRLNRIFRGYRNLGLHEVRGWDLNVDYGFSLLSGYLDLNYFATKIDERSIVDDTFGDVNFECVGQFNGACDNLISYPVFDFKHRMTAGWSKGDLDLQLVWRYNAALDDGNEQVQYYREKLSSYSLFDFSGRYQVNDNLALTVGIRNIADKQPEPIGTNSWEYTSVANRAPAVSNTYTQYYDVYGRTAFMKLTATF